MNKLMWGATGFALLALVVLMTGCCCCSMSPPSGVRTLVTPETIVTRTPSPAPSPTLPPVPATSTVGRVTVGETAHGVLNTSSAIDVWTFTIDESVTVDIDLRADGGRWDPILEVAQPGGPVIAYDDDGGEGLNSRLAGLSLAPGAYEIRVRAFSGFGSYTLSVERAGEVAVTQTIEYGETVQGLITEAAPRQSWLFEGQAGDTISISMVGRGDFRDTYLELYAPDGQLATQDDDSGEGLSALIVGYVLPEDGAYTIVARAFGGFETGEYELALNTFEIEIRTIVYGETLSGRLDPDMPQDYWQFEGQAGDVVSILMVGRDEFRDTYLELYDLRRELIASDDDSGGNLSALIGSIVLPQTGSYGIVARGYGGQSGPYELTLTRIKERTISYGQTLSGELTDIEQRAVWTFEGSAGDLVSISMVGLGSLQNTYLELHDLDGTVLAQDDDSGKGSFARIEGYVLPVDGTYRIVASAFDEAGFSSAAISAMPWVMLGPAQGAYRLTLLRMEARTIAYGQTSTGELTEEIRRGYWTFEGQAGDVVSIALDGQGALVDTYIELYGPDGDLVAEDDDGGPGYAALIERLILPQTGVYRVVTRAVGEQSGPYRLAVRREALTEQTLTYGETGAGELTLNEPRGFWRFEGAAGDQVDISMVGLGALTDTYLELYGPDGTLLVVDDDGGEGLFARIAGYTLPDTGSYRIVARAYSGQLDEYELRLEGRP